MMQYVPQAGLAVKRAGARKFAAQRERNAYARIVAARMQTLEVSMKTVWVSLNVAMLFGVAMLLGAVMLLAQPALARNQQMRSGASQMTSSQPAAAQPSETQNQQNVMAKDSSTAPQDRSASLKQQLKDNLIKSGFTNVQVFPESFLIRAKDPQGNPIAMAVTPDTLAAVEFGKGNMMSGRSVGQGEPRFISGAVRDAAEAHLTNTRVQSSDKKNVGTISNIVVGDNGQLSYLVTTDNGREVAINPDDMKLSYNENDDIWMATVDATKNQIDSAPQAQVE
jgi:hypothetical protein